MHSPDIVGSVVEKTNIYICPSAHLHLVYSPGATWSLLDGEYFCEVHGRTYIKSSVYYIFTQDSHSINAQFQRPALGWYCMCECTPPISPSLSTLCIDCYLGERSPRRLEGQALHLSHGIPSSPSRFCHSCLLKVGKDTRDQELQAFFMLEYAGRLVSPGLVSH